MSLECRLDGNSEKKTKTNNFHLLNNSFARNANGEWLANWCDDDCVVYTCSLCEVNLMNNVRTYACVYRNKIYKKNTENARRKHTFECPKRWVSRQSASGENLCVMEWWVIQHDYSIAQWRNITHSRLAQIACEPKSNAAAVCSGVCVHRSTLMGLSASAIGIKSINK